MRGRPVVLPVQRHALQTLTRFIAHGWTITRVAAATGATAGRVYHYRNGEALPPVEWCNRVLTLAAKTLPLHATRAETRAAIGRMAGAGIEVEQMALALRIPAARVRELLA